MGDLLENQNEELIVEIEIVHEGESSNGLYFEKEALQKSVGAWTYPYNKPVIMHHNTDDGITVGRVIHAKYREDSIKKPGYAAQVIYAKILGKEHVDMVKDGRLDTVSIGAKSDDTSCSICGKNTSRFKGECSRHKVGSIYNGKKCLRIVNNFNAYEASYVINPSDKFAGNIKIISNEEFEKIKEGDKENMIIQNSESLTKIEETEETSNATVDINESFVNMLVKGITDGLSETISTQNEAMIESMEKTFKSMTEIKEKEGEVDGLQDNKKEDIKEEEKEVEIKEEITAEDISSSHKEQAVELYFTLRALCGKPEISKEELSKRSLEYLNDAIKDCTVDFKGKKEAEVKAAEAVEPEAKEADIVESSASELKEIEVEDPSEIEIKEKIVEKKEYVDLNESLNSILSR